MSDPVCTPAPPPEWGQWAFAGTLFVVAVAALVAVALGVFDQSATTVRSVIPVQLSAAAQSQPPTVPVPVSRPAATPRAKAAVRRSRDAGGSARRRAGGRRPISPSPRVRLATTGPSSSVEHNQSKHSSDAPTSPVTATPWIEAFYPIYATAQKTVGVNWLLIASIHEQESAFSTDPTTYRGLNFAGCCGGPMQFNVTNGPVTTWDIARNAYRLGKRPPAYAHRTATHPSIYDDFDSIMAAAWLLSSDGAGLALNDSAWIAAFDYYGHDAAGVAYADVVLARAIGWSQHGFCPGCEVKPSLVRAVHEAYGEHR